MGRRAVFESGILVPSALGFDIKELLGIGLGRKSAVVLVHDGRAVPAVQRDPGDVPGLGHRERDGTVPGSIGDPARSRGPAGLGDGTGELGGIPGEDLSLWWPNKRPEPCLSIIGKGARRRDPVLASVPEITTCPASRLTSPR